MFNPGELEGAVDHSFFDSDCDDRRDGGKKMERSWNNENESPQKNANTTCGLSLTSDGTKKHPQQVEGICSNGSKSKENSCLSMEEEKSRASSVSPVASRSPKVITNGSDSEEDSNKPYKKSSGTFLALLADAREADEEDVSQASSNVTQKEAPSNPKYSESKGNRRSPKKLIRKRHQSPAPTSSDASADTDSEIASRCGKWKSSLKPPLCSQESQDTETDVGPFSSPDISPLQSLGLSDTEVEEEQQESVPSSVFSNILEDEDSTPDVDECSLIPEALHRNKLAFHCPQRNNRKNYSFSNNEVLRIDRENQRLVQALARVPPQSRPGSKMGQKSCTVNNSARRPDLVFHSAVNRQREQKRIERENLVFLKRLTAIKPTPGLVRSEQLADYHRKVAFTGAPPPYIATTTKERSTSRTPSAGSGSSQGIGAHCTARAVSKTPDSGSTTVPRSKKLSAAKPDWN